MAAQQSELFARLIDLFGSPATADPTKLYGNLTVSPNGNILVGTATDDGVSKLQVNGAAIFSARPTFNGKTPWDSGNSNPGRTLISSQVIASAAQVHFIFFFKQKTAYEIIFEKVQGTGNLAIQFSSNNGASWDNSTIYAQTHQYSNE